MNAVSASLEEAVRDLEEAKFLGKEAEFACDNPHWWIGVRSDGTFWWNYYCCDTCEQWDWEEDSCSSFINERFKDTVGLWIRTI